MKRPSRQRRAHQRAFVILGIFLLFPVWMRAEPLASPSWGFSIDLPEGYSLVGGDGKNQFSFAAESGAFVDLIVYQPSRFASLEEVARYTEESLRAEAESSAFSYRDKKAILMSLAFEAEGGKMAGWGLCVELHLPATTRKEGGKTPMLLALAYGPEGEQGLDGFHRSALDSIAVTAADRYAPGPLSAFAYPSLGRKVVRVAGLEAEATIDEADAEAAKALVDREFAVLTYYASSPLWKEAWTRFYRFIYRDSYERLADLSLTVERTIQASTGAPSNTDRLLAEQTLAWVQGFAYERDLMGSDFVDLVTAATEGSGDCDSRALLFAVVLMHAGIESSIMVSRDYSHAMGLVAMEGTGARFGHGGKKWMVAETTAKVPLGLIGKDSADPAKWLGILLQ